jgi:hypothetical protein
MAVHHIIRNRKNECGTSDYALGQQTLIPSFFESVGFRSAIAASRTVLRKVRRPDRAERVCPWARVPVPLDEQMIAAKAGGLCLCCGVWWGYFIARAEEVTAVYPRFSAMRKMVRAGGLECSENGIILGKIRDTNAVRR